MLNNIGEYAIVAKVDVSNLDASAEWYATRLGMQEDPQFRSSGWAQLRFPGQNGFTMGLNLDAAHTGSGGAVTTFVVQNIEAAVAELRNNGVDVGPIQNAGEGVQLAFFQDPDRNSLGLRQQG